MKLTRAMKRVTGRLTTMRLITGQLNGHAKGQWLADSREASHWSTEWPWGGSMVSWMAERRVTGQLTTLRRPVTLFTSLSSPKSPRTAFRPSSWKINAIHKFCIWIEDNFIKIAVKEQIFCKCKILRIRVHSLIISLNKGKEYLTLHRIRNLLSQFVEIKIYPSVNKTNFYGNTRFFFLNNYIYWHLLGERISIHPKPWLGGARLRIRIHHIPYGPPKFQKVLDPDRIKNKNNELSKKI